MLFNVMPNEIDDDNYVLIVAIKVTINFYFVYFYSSYNRTNVPLGHFTCFGLVFRWDYR